MKKIFALIVSMLLILCLLASCGGNDAPKPAQNTENTAQNSQEQTTPPEGSPSETNTAVNETNTAANEAAPAEQNTPAPPAVTVEFDPKAYQNPNNDEYFNGLIYATNNTDKAAQVTFKYKVFDTEGKIISAFDHIRNRYFEESKDSVFVPAGAKDLPVGFALPWGYGYDISTDKKMPEIGHIEYELAEIKEDETEDLRDHFTAGEPEIKNNHIYIYVKFDQEIGDNYATLFTNYTLLGYSNGEIIAICCENNFPYGTTSHSVANAKEKNDGAFLIYQNIPRDPVDKWELHLGCIAGEK